MPALPNARHERFAQALAKGLTASEAYIQAGYKPHNGNFVRLRENERIRGRVSQLQEKGAKRAEVTIESLSAELEEARAAAMKAGQAAAAVSATMGKAKLHGLIVEKHKHSGAIGTYDLTKVSDEHLNQLESILGPLADAGGDSSGEAQTQH